MICGLQGTLSALLLAYGTADHSGRYVHLEEVRFFTRSGILTARWRDGWIDMDFPAEPERHYLPPGEFVAALGVAPLYTGKNRLNDWLIEIESEKVLRNLTPDITLLRTIPMRGVMVTARSITKGFGFLSRFFAPSIGIDEDPVTGSAHCCLGACWQKRLKQFTFFAYQASRRGGVVPGVSPPTGSSSPARQ